MHQRLDCACEARDPFVWADVPGFPVSRFGAFQHHLLWPLMVCFPGRGDVLRRIIKNSERIVPRFARRGAVLGFAVVF